MDKPIYQKLDPGTKESWVQALRSGRYIQGRKRLKTFSGTYCCLGVLAQEAGVLAGYSCGGSDGSIPNNVLDLDIHAVDWLVNMNDKEEKSFDEIADWIEKNL